MELRFKFFRDKNGRLRANLQFGDLGKITKPVERRDGKRYKILKVFQIPPTYAMQISEFDRQRLQNAKEGDEIVIRVSG